MSTPGLHTIRFAGCVAVATAALTASAAVARAGAQNRRVEFHLLSGVPVRDESP